MSLTSGETFNCRKEFLTGGTPPALASAIVDVAPVLDVKAVVCLGKCPGLVVKQLKKYRKPRLG